MTDLAQRWTATMRLLARNGDLAGVGADLIARYTQSHRRYHGLEHLAAVLSHVDELAHQAADPSLVEIAAWFHDAVYDPRRDDNEDQSAVLAETVLADLHVDPNAVKEIARLVRITANHFAMPDDRNAAVLCDADLAVLGSDEAAYSAYRDNIRHEYEHLDAASFERGRSLVLRQLLDREPLFATPYGQSRWEPAARRNMMAELVTLS